MTALETSPATCMASFKSSKDTHLIAEKTGGAEKVAL